ncbi:hypothetical protein KJ632_00675 [Patescibacteria group bacterium]|nr:hypothetical protein [Patescibacteria group bacterium]
MSEPVTLNVSVSERKNISSKIVHNEPTNYTISKQVTSLGSKTLPIDNPRYVAFQSKPRSGQIFGELQKVYYPNLFETPNYAQLVVELEQIAAQIAAMPGASAIMGGSGQYNQTQIKERILTDYLMPVIESPTDVPKSGYNLVRADKKRLFDALKWFSSNVDDKHAYILEYYLNAEKEAYVDDPVYPPKLANYVANDVVSYYLQLNDGEVADAEPFAGYEAAYLLMDGGEDYFDLNFSKAYKEDNYELEQMVARTEVGEEGPQIVEEEEAGKKDGKFTISIFKLFPEFKRFLEDLKRTGELTWYCLVSEETQKDREELAEDMFAPEELDKNSAGSNLPVASLKLKLSRDAIYANGQDSVTVIVMGLDENGNRVSADSNNVKVKVFREQNRDVLNYSGAQEYNLVDGLVSFKFNSTKTTGEANIYAVATKENGQTVRSQKESLVTVGTKIKMSTHIAYVPEGLEELIGEIKALEQEVVADDDDVQVVPGDDDDEIVPGDDDDDGVPVDEGQVPVGMPDLGDDDDFEDVLSDLAEGLLGVSFGSINPMGGAQLIEYVLLYRSLIEVVGAVLSENRRWEDFYSSVEYYERYFGNEVKKEEPEEPWEDFYYDVDYYENFIASNRLLAALETPPGAIGSAGNVQIDACAVNLYYPLAEEKNPFTDARRSAEPLYRTQPSNQMTADCRSLMMAEALVFDATGEPDFGEHRVKFYISDERFNEPTGNEQSIATFASGELYDENNRRVSDPKNAAYTVVEPEEDGLYRAYLRAGKKTGSFKINVEVLDGIYPIVTNEVMVVAGEPSYIEVDPDSSVLVANGQSKTNIDFIVRDKYGNRVEQSYDQVGVFANQDISYMDEGKDENDDILGIQLPVNNGVASIDLFAKDEIGEVTVIAVLIDYDLESAFYEAENDWRQIDFSKHIGTAKTFKIIDEVKLGLELEDESIQVEDGQTRMSVVVLDGDNKVVSEYKGPFTADIINKSVLDFAVDLPPKMVNGRVNKNNIRLKAKNLAGRSEIAVDVPGFASTTTTLEVLPGPGEVLELSADGDALLTDGENEIVLTARLKDGNGNLVSTDSSTLVSVVPTSTTASNNASDQMFEFVSDNKEVAFDAGEARIKIRGTEFSGPINFYAALSLDTSVRSEMLPLKVTKRVASPQIENFDPRVLYVSLLGSAFGDPSFYSQSDETRNNLAQSFLYNGQVQAVTSLTASIDDNKRLISLDAKGKVDMLDQNLEYEVFASAGNFPYQRVVFSDPNEEIELGYSFVVPKPDSELAVVEDFELSNGEGIFAQALSGFAEGNFEFEEKQSTTRGRDNKYIYLKEDGEKKVVVDNYGRISLLDDTYSFDLPFDPDAVSQYAAYSIYKGTEPIAVIYYKYDFEKDVEFVPEDSRATHYSPGVYFKASTDSSRYGVKGFFTGSSSNGDLGLFVTDTETEINAESKPGFSYTSLENAKEEAGLGFHGQNKHMLLFAAGNSVGESHKHYASEIGINYGDPLVHLSKEREGVLGSSYYAQDIGSMIFSGVAAIKELIEFDVNNDGYGDLAIVYENGEVRLLENRDGFERFEDRGNILNIAGGIFSAQKIDANNDGYDDLLIGSKEECVVGEECLSLYMNEQGHFVRQTLNLAVDGKVLKILTGDSNADGCMDIFASDSSGNIRIFNNNVKNGACVGWANGPTINYSFSRNFGYSIDSGQNAVKSLFVYYPGMIERTNSNMHKFVQLTIESTTPPPATSASAIDPDAATDPNYDSATYASQAEDLHDFFGDISSRLNVSDVEGAGSVGANEVLTYPRDYYFLHILQDDNFNSSVKQGVDVDGEMVRIDDTIEYTLQLRNSSGRDIRNMMISDATPLSLELNMDSLQCLDTGCRDRLEWVETGVVGRSHAIKGISVPAGGIRTIKYSFKVLMTSKVDFEIGHDLVSGASGFDNLRKYDCPPLVGQCDVKDDPYLDILVRPAYKSDPREMFSYIYSRGLSANGNVLYSIKMVKEDEEEQAGGFSNAVTDAFADLGIDFGDLTDSIMDKPDDWPTDEPWPSMDIENPQWPDSSDLEKAMKDNEISDELKDSVKAIFNKQFADKNYNGLVDSWEPFGTFSMSPANVSPSYDVDGDPVLSDSAGGNGGTGYTLTDVLGGISSANRMYKNLANNVAGAISNAMNLLRCSGAGCLPIPYNYAFLVPNMAIPGTPLLAFAIPFGPFVMPVIPFWPSMAAPPSQARLYISPTLDGGLGMALCVGPGIGHMSPCWSVSMPMGALGICPDFAGMIAKLIAKAKALAMKAASKVGASTGDDATGMIMSNLGEAAKDELNDIGVDSDFDSGALSGAVAMNIRIPGFPAVITDWFDKQIDEIYIKLMDLPDIYVLYPDFPAWIEQFKKAGKNFDKVFESSDERGFNSARDFLQALASIPLFEIEGKPVQIKFPMISQEEILKYEVEAQLWLEYEKEQWKKWSGLFKEEGLKCEKENLEPDEQTLCDKLNKFKADFTKMTKTVESIADTIDKIKRFPQIILQWRYWEAKYAKQLICYMDLLMNYFVGYVTRQMKIISEWIKAVQKVIKTIKDWKMIINLILDFKIQCDECKNHRFSLLGLLLQLMVVIPSPPIIPLPKLPDFVLDLSEFRTGVKIVWPDLTFTPQFISLPNLPVIDVPNIPGFELQIPGWMLNFELPQLPELPDLPGIPLPFLPDLPRPPEIPELAQIVIDLILTLRPILKILCLIMKALIPVMESALEVEIETMTQPNIDIILPIIAALSFQFPAISYDYVEKIKISIRTNISAEFEPLYLLVKSGTDYYNNAISELVALLQLYIDYYDPQVLIDNAIAIAYELALEEIKEIFRNDSDPSNNANIQAYKKSEKLRPLILKLEAGENPNSITQDDLDKIKIDDAELKEELRQALEAAAGDYEFSGGLPVRDEEMIKSLPEAESEEIKKIKRDELSYKKLMKTLAVKLDDNPYYAQLVSKTTEFSRVISDYVATLPKQDIPEFYNLKAQVSYIDSSHPSLNRSLEEIEAKIAQEVLPEDNPGIAHLANIRDEMIAYTKNLDEANRLLANNTDDPKGFYNVLAMRDESLEPIVDLTNPNRYLADSDGRDIAKRTMSDYGVSASGVMKGSFYGKEIENTMAELAGDKNRMLAQVTLEAPEVDQLESAGASSDSSSLNVQAPQGVFVVTGPDAAENVLFYTEELNDNPHMIFTDVDKDLDDDLIVSMGSDVYLKERYKRNPTTRRGRNLGDGQLSSYLANYEAVQNLNSASSSYRSADISWSKHKNEKIIAYELLIRKSLFDDPDSPEKRYLVLTTPAKGDQIDNDSVIELADPENPSVSIELDNGNFYINIFALDKDGNKSLISNEVLISPSQCADKTPPFPAINNSYRVPIHQSLKIDARNSFDAEGDIIEYYVETLPYAPSELEAPYSLLPQTLWSDMNVIVDSDGDGNKMNDKSNPIIVIPAFRKPGDIGVHNFKLHIVDQSGNSSAQDFSVEVFVPEITLSEVISSNPIAEGETLEETYGNVPQVPFVLMRERNVLRILNRQLVAIPRLEKIITQSALLSQGYRTDEAGQYNIRDFDLEDMILVENDAGMIVSEIHPKTANIGALVDGYSVEAYEAVPPVRPTSLGIIENSTGRTMASVYVVADSNIDVTVHEQFSFEDSDFNLLFGVHVNDLDPTDSFDFVKYPADNPHYPGGVALLDRTDPDPDPAASGSKVALIDTGGNILLTNDKMSISHKENDHKIDPLIYELRSSDTVVAEVYVSATSGLSEAVILGPDDVPYALPRSPRSLNFGSEQYDYILPEEEQVGDTSDVIDLVNEMIRNGAIDNLYTENGFEFDPFEFISRAQFIKALLTMLCIVPRSPEAFLPYNNQEVEGGFYDVPYNDGYYEWYYPYIKEATLRGMAEGYRGEEDRDVATGLAPFRPDNTITRAEAVKIIIDSLVMQGVLDGKAFADIDPESSEVAWYEPYMQAAVDLTPYLPEGVYLQNNNIIKDIDLNGPDEELVFIELLQMVERVIAVTNCQELDADNDGMSDFCEERYRVDNPFADPDHDGLNNAEECALGINPTDQDTDRGGVLDGAEVNIFGTDPLNILDDPLDNDGDGLTNAAEILIYGTNPEDPDTDNGGVRDGDEVFQASDPNDEQDEVAHFGGLSDIGRDEKKGIYIVPAECNVCPCPSTLLYKADLKEGDKVFAEIVTEAQDYVFNMSQEYIINTINTP